MIGGVYNRLQSTIRTNEYEYYVDTCVQGDISFKMIKASKGASAGLIKNTIEAVEAEVKKIF